MEDTTQRDLVPPTFDGFDGDPRHAASPAQSEELPGPVAPRSAEQLSASFAVPSARATPGNALGERSGVIVAPGAAGTEEMTFASRVPPDHPGLRLEGPRARALRRGPIILVAALIGVSVLIAMAIAFSPRAEQAHAAVPSLGEGDHGKNVTISDTVQNAPANNSQVRPAPPKLGPPVHGADRSAQGPGEHHEATSAPVFGGASVRDVVREERAKASGSSILVDLEGPSDNTLAGAAAGVTAPFAAMAASATKAEPPSAGLPVGGAGTGDANMQQHKNDFLSRDGVNTATYLGQPVVLPRSPYEIKAGTIIPASLLTAINSDLPGQIIGQVRENVYDTVSGNYLLIPQGSKLLATYDSAVSYGQERVLFCWNRLVRPDGVSLSLECMPGADLAGASGATDDVNHHWWRIITGVALGTLLSATADRAAGNVTGYQPTVAQSWAMNAGGAINQVGQQITQKNLAIQPTITVRAGYSVNVIVTKDIVFPPYARPATP
ncbi:MAG TPA: TrbI/VirB10 family protein [Polyangia bacterium]|nr:TrbI/VirB10 family protein [Polyangia bacterium]